MNRRLMILLFAAGLWSACAGGDPSSSEDEIQELTLRQRLSGSISVEGDVDWYYFRAVDTNNIIQIHCTSDTLRPDVDLLVSLYETDAAGEKVLIYSDHATEGAQRPANLLLTAYIDRPKDIYVSVRDLMDDDCSENPYYISIDFGSPPEGNDNFLQAAPLLLGENDCPVDTIGSVGDIDCFRFDAAGGIYDVSAVFSPLPDTPVQLCVSLYDGDGNLVGKESSLSRQTFHLLHYLSPGEYFVNVEDFGRDHFDNASTYRLCVNQTTGVESSSDDAPDDAVPVDVAIFDQSYTVSGSLDYNQDQDWYRIDAPTFPGGFRVLNVGFESTARIEYQISVLDAATNVLMSHQYQGGTTAYQTQIKIEPGDTFLLVQPAGGQHLEQSAGYTATITALDVIDNADSEPNTNDSVTTADVLTPTADPAGATSGKIGYRTDVDWYTVTVPAHAGHQVLECFFEAPVSQVAYTVSIFKDQLEKKLYNLDAANTATQLKTALLLPPSTQDATYTIKVGDYHDDDGDDASYTLRVALQDIPATLPPVAAGAPPQGASVVYHNEANESTTSTIEVAFNSLTQKHFGVDTQRLQLSNATASADLPEAGLTTLVFPWIGGYMDYQGDYDFFEIDLQSLDGTSDWYYEIQVELYSPGGAVEYVWKYFTDPQDDAVVMDRPRWYDGFLASAGDDDPAIQMVNLVTPDSGDEPFWIGNPWAGKSYFSISDFNYIENTDGTPYSEPDADWGAYGDAPYYFRVTLVYHPGVSSP